MHWLAQNPDFDDLDETARKMALCRKQSAQFENTEK